MSDLPDRITARVDYDGEWDGQWCEQGREPIGIHAYHFDTYVRSNLCDAVENEWRKDWEAMRAERDALAEKLERAVEALGRLGSGEAFTTPFGADTRSREWQELAARKQYAEAILAALRETTP